jgi:hemerythrin superfamily protein
MAARKQTSENNTANVRERRASAPKAPADRGRRTRRASSTSAHAERRRGGTASPRARKTSASKVARRRTASMNAIAMLKDDHDRVLDMFEKFERARREDQKQTLADRICADLTLHAQVEEELFYPALRDAIGEQDLVDEAEVEHASAKMLIAQIQRGKAGDPQWDAKVKVLGEYVRHHIREEQREIFPRARQAKQLDLRALGERIAERKEGGPLPEMRATAAAMVGGEMGNADKARAQAPGMLETAVRALLPGGGDR